MDTKKATKLRRSVKSCPNCDVKDLPKISDLKSGPEAVMWSRRHKMLSQLAAASRLTILVGDPKTCQKHRDRIVRELDVLFEVDFVPDGSTDEILPTVRKSHAWFTLYWKSPQKVKKEEKESWISQGRSLGQMVRGYERLPKMPKKLRDFTHDGKVGQLNWWLESYGYAKVYSRTMGEEVVILRDDEVTLPQGYAPGVPRFTLDELLRLRWFKGMKAEEDMFKGTWLLKKHLGASVVR